MSSLLRVKILSQFSEFEWAFFFIKIDILLRGRKHTGTVKRITYFYFFDFSSLDLGIKRTVRWSVGGIFTFSKTSMVAEIL